MNELDIWINQLWIDIPKELCTSGNKGSKPLFVKALEKLNPDKALRIEITRGTLKKKRIDMIKYKTGQKFSSWPHCVRHITGERWKDYEDEKDPADQTSHKEKPTQTCSTAGCTFGSVVLNKCAKCHTESVKHLDPLREKKVELWKRLELGKKPDETQSDYIERMKQIARRGGYRRAAT